MLVPTSQLVVLKSGLYLFAASRPSGFAETLNFLLHFLRLLVFGWSIIQILPFHQALVVIVFDLVIKQVKLRLTITSRRKKERLWNWFWNRIWNWLWKLVLKLIMKTCFWNWFWNRILKLDFETGTGWLEELSRVEVNTAYSDPRQLFWSTCRVVLVVWMVERCQRAKMEAIGPKDKKWKVEDVSHHKTMPLAAGK